MSRTATQTIASELHIKDSKTNDSVRITYYFEGQQDEQYCRRITYFESENKIKISGVFIVRGQSSLSFILGGQRMESSGHTSLNGVGGCILHV